MNKIVNKFFVNKVAAQIAIKTTKIYLTSWKDSKKIKIKKTGDLNYVYKNKLDKACFAHGTEYADSNDLAKRTISDKIFKDGSYKIAINPKS